jgi:hypothetical protein
MRRVAQQTGHLRARHALLYQKDAVQPVVVPRFPRPLNFFLQTQHRSGIEVVQEFEVHPGGRALPAERKDPCPGSRELKWKFRF